MQTGMSMASDGSLPLHVDDLLRYAVSVGASDLHLAAGMPGVIRLHGALRRIEGCPLLENEMIRDMVFGILPASQRERFEEQKELDTSHSIAGVGRFRVNVAMQRGTVAAALRPIPHEIPAFDGVGVARARSGRSPSFAAAWSSSPVRPARGSPPRWLRSSTSSTGRSHSTS